MDMDRFVTEQNIERYRKLASGALTAPERRAILLLLAEEEAMHHDLCRASIEPA
jgi:hypothetical protein